MRTPGTVKFLVKLFSKSLRRAGQSPANAEKHRNRKPGLPGAGNAQGSPGFLFAACPADSLAADLFILSVIKLLFYSIRSK